MNKIDLINKISSEFGISKIESSEYLESLLDILAKSFRKGKNINIAEFGKLRSFTKYIEDGRRGKFISFSPVKKLADDVNSDFNDLFATTVALLNDKSRFDLISIEELEPEEDSIIVFDDSGYEDIPVERFAIDEEPEDLIERSISGSGNITIEEVDFELDKGNEIEEDYAVETIGHDDSQDEIIPEIIEDEISHGTLDDDIVNVLKSEATFENELTESESEIEQDTQKSKSFYEELISEPEEISFADGTTEEPETSTPSDVTEVDTDIKYKVEEPIEEESEPITISDKVTEVIPYKEKEETEEFVDPDDLLPGHMKDDVIENVVAPPGDHIALTDDLLKIIEERRRLLLESDNGDDTETVEPEIHESKPEVTETISDKVISEEKSPEDVIDDNELRKVEAERQKFLDEQKSKKEVTNILEEYGIYREPTDEEIESKPEEKKPTDEDEEKFNSILKQYGIYNEENGKDSSDTETQDVTEEDEEEQKVKNILEEYGIQRDEEVDEVKPEEPETGNILDEYGVIREPVDETEVPTPEIESDTSKEQAREEGNILDEYGVIRDTDEKTTEQEQEKADDDIEIPEMDFGKIFKGEVESDTHVQDEIIEDEREVVIPDELKTLHEEISEEKKDLPPPPPVNVEPSYDDVFELRTETTSQKTSSSKPEYNLGLNKEEEEKDDSKIFTLSFVILIFVILIVALLTYTVFNYGLIGSDKEKAQEMIIEDEPTEQVITEEDAGQNQRMDLLKTDETDDVEEVPVPTEVQERQGDQRQLAPGEEEQIAYPEAKVVIIRTKDGYFIQVGSYSRENVAQQKVAELKGKGADAFMIRSELERGTFYRVRVGSFDNLDSAKSYADKNLN